jgi:hypothetical protein
VATIPNPAIGSLRTPPAIQHEVIARRATGSSKRQIARDLGIARKTVDAVLAGSPIEQPSYATVLQELTTKSFVRVTQAIDTEKDTDTARWALEHTVFKPEQAASYQVNGDLTMNAVLGMLPTSRAESSTASTPSLPTTASTTSSPGTAESTGQATEAAAKAAGGDIGLSLQTNFSNFSTEQLEQELARRRAADSIDVEAVPCP